MNFYSQNLEDFIEKIKKEDDESIKELYKTFEGFMVKNYNDKIGIAYGNEYFEDYLSEVNLSMFEATLNFKGSTKNSFKNFIFKTILNCGKKISRDKCKPQYVFKYLDDENDLECLDYIKKSSACKEAAIFKQINLINDLTPYLKDKLKPLEFQLFKDVYYKEEKLNYFAEIHNYNYSTLRSISSRIKKKIKYEEIKSILY